ncbi:MAG: hypothetical protein LAT68_09695 [Cyclobacteriaceae bacterium]|nr:hypothetical protein [Cyclobacteriaceae bacterium]MCH8516588.1 hypothetical protein [Cyclobacteriaceae bacterium]
MEQSESLNSKEKLIQKLQAINNPYLITQIEIILESEGSVKKVGQFAEKYPDLLGFGDMELNNQKVITGITDLNTDNWLSRYELKSIPFLSLISFILLILLAYFFNVYPRVSDHLIFYLKFR